MHSPVFIICSARSGSTLLGYMLDAHPEIACPAETSLIGMAFEYARGSVAATIAARSLVLDVTNGMLDASGKSIWCNKDLNNISYLKFIRTIFPGARYICLYRHCMDMVASGLEASRWGFGRYGFGPYALRNTTNLVAAIGTYWAERTAQMLALEDEPAYDTFRLRYEDLVCAPDKVLPDLLEFTGAATSTALTEAIVAGSLLRPRNGDGEDPKIAFKTSVGRQSVGRGRAIPAALITGDLRAQVNRCLRTLAYCEIGDDWNYAADPAVPERRIAGGNGAGDLAGLLPMLLNGRDMPGLLPEGTCMVISAVTADGTRQSWWLDRSTGTWKPGQGEPAADRITVTTRHEVLRELLLGGLAIDAAIRARMLTIAPDPGKNSWAVEKFIGTIFGG